MRSIVLSSLAAVALNTTACAGSPGPSSTGVPETTVRGTAALLTFPSKPLRLVATNEVGKAAGVSIGASGQFALALTKGHSYRLAVVTARNTVPVVFPRQSGRLDTTFVVKSAGANINLGSVHRLISAPAGGFTVQSATIGTGSPNAQDGEGDCVDCVDDPPSTTCASNADSETESQANDESGSSGGAQDMSGKSNTETGDQADPGTEIAVGEQNAPEQVDGCDSQTGDNAQGEQQGEH
jgi:hypothetical protein